MVKADVNIHYDVIVPVTVELENYDEYEAIAAAEDKADNMIIDLNAYDTYMRDACVTEVHNI